MSVLVAGGGLAMGQVAGSSNSKGEIPVDAPYRPEDVLATMYAHLGIDPRQTFTDFAGRPRYVLEQGEPIAELTGAASDPTPGEPEGDGTTLARG